MSNCICLSVEIEVPENLDEEYTETILGDLSYEDHIQRLRRIVKQWARHITSESCHIEITVD